ncbi:MAG: 16S rRNA (cytosine(1402)-N(4))-methyltransferase RsmH [Lachnospiraceae bacterium]|nr:16S rRNA (cytosine(1402)-N(4))-methyltransferase RsmH [Lachnospiraceae bacterium]
MIFEHKSVLLKETIEGLDIKPDGIYVDGTLGGAGHSGEILKKLSKGGRLIGIDQDEAAIMTARDRIGQDERVSIVRDNYEHVPGILHGMQIDKVDGILLDLGVSSYQLDTDDRGFSYKSDAPLDMRMDQRQRITAREIVNGYEERELFRIIRDYGEEKFAQNIAKHIVLERAKKPIETTYELNEIIKTSIPARMRQDGHPSKRTYQAIRIECNRELEVLKNSIEGMIDLLNGGGRLAIITFHSLEDRIVKTAYRTAEDPCICPPNFPQCVCGRVSKGRVVNKKPITASAKELECNSRSKSAKLRIFEKA